MFDLFAAILRNLVVMIRVVPILSLGVFAARKKYQQEKQQRGSFHRSLLHQRLTQADKIADFGNAGQQAPFVRASLRPGKTPKAAESGQNLSPRAETFYLPCTSYGLVRRNRTTIVFEVAENERSDP
jgi:hypothetical protein